MSEARHHLANVKFHSAPEAWAGQWVNMERTPEEGRRRCVIMEAPKDMLLHDAASCMATWSEDGVVRTEQRASYNSTEAEVRLAAALSRARV